MNGTHVGTTAALETTYQQTADLVTGEHYEFKVSAVNAIDTGALSAGVEIIAATVPYAPAQATKKSASASHIEPEWVAPFNGGSDIRGYKVYKDGVHKAPDFATNFDELSLVITDQIVPGDEYQITVVAFNDVGDGIPSDPKTIMAAAVPDPPLDLTLVSQGPTAITIKWTPPYNGGTDLSNYKIWWDNASGGATSTFIEKEGSTGLVTQFTIQTNIVTNNVY